MNNFNSNSQSCESEKPWNRHASMIRLQIILASKRNEDTPECKNSSLVHLKTQTVENNVYVFNTMFYTTHHNTIFIYSFEYKVSQFSISAYYCHNMWSWQMHSLEINPQLHSLCSEQSKQAWRVCCVAVAIPTTIIINLSPSLALGHKAATAKVSAFSGCRDIRQPGATSEFAQPCKDDTNQ